MGAPSGARSVKKRRHIVTVYEFDAVFNESACQLPRIGSVNSVLTRDKVANDLSLLKNRLIWPLAIKAVEDRLVITSIECESQTTRHPLQAADG